MTVVTEDVRVAAGGLKLCAGQEAGVEATVHAMHDVFQSNEKEAVLLVYAENAFNSINRKVLLQNIYCVIVFMLTRHSMLVDSGEKIIYAEIENDRLEIRHAKYATVNPSPKSSMSVQLPVPAISEPIEDVNN